VICDTNSEGGKNLAPLSVHTDSVMKLDFSFDSLYLVSVGLDKRICIYA
jgi:WD40 repeat protein